MNNTISVAEETILVSSVVIICSKVKKKKTRVRTPSLQSVKRWWIPETLEERLELILDPGQHYGTFNNIIRNYVVTLQPENSCIGLDRRVLRKPLITCASAQLMT